MSLHIHSHTEDSKVILDLNGMITLGAGSVTLREELRERLAGDAQCIVLDCSAVELVDSSGLAELLSAHVQAEKLGRKLILSNIGGRLKGMLDATRLSTVLNIDLSHPPRNAMNA